MEVEEIEIILLPEDDPPSGAIEPMATGDPSESSEESGRLLSIHGRLQRTRKPRVHITYDVLPSVGQAVTIAVPAATALIGAWLQARLGRKVRIKVGDIEAEASTVEEVAELLKQATDIREKSSESDKP